MCTIKYKLVGKAESNIWENCTIYTRLWEDCFVSGKVKRASDQDWWGLTELRERFIWNTNNIFDLLEIPM